MSWTQMQTLYFAVFLSLAIGHLTGLIVYTTQSQQTKSVIKTVLFVWSIIYILINIFVIPYMNRLGYRVTCIVTIFCSPIFIFTFSSWLYNQFEKRYDNVKRRILLYIWTVLGGFILIVFVIEFFVHLFSS